MPLRFAISLVVAWTFTFQAFAGVAGGSCRHAPKAQSPETVAAVQQDAHAQHGSHHTDRAQPQKSPIGCGCGCNCAGDCVHACQLSAVLFVAARMPVTSARDVPAVLLGQVLASHKLLLLRPPAALQA